MPCPPGATRERGLRLGAKKRSAGAVSIAFLLACAPGLASADRTLVAAASDLRYPLQEIAETFERDHGAPVAISFGSSGIFATQIRQGAPFDLFLSADEDYVLALHAEGLTRDRGEVYAIGRLALIASDGSDLPVDAGLAGLSLALANGSIGRFAIANPAHAPYGKRAEEVLRHAGLWDSIRPSLVLGENVSQATLFALDDQASGGIVALSMVIALQQRRRIRHALVPAAWHSPLRQRMVLLRRADVRAEAFFRYVQSPPARHVMRRHGFELPDEAS